MDAESTPNRDRSGDVRHSGSTAKDQQKRGRDKRPEAGDQPAPSRHPIQPKNENLRQPFVVHPGLLKPGERVGVVVEDAVILYGQLPGAQVPPYVGIGHAARGHDEQSQGQDEDEYASSLEELFHQSEDNTSPGIPRYKIASPLRTGE